MGLPILLSKLRERSCFRYLKQLTQRHAIGRAGCELLTVSFPERSDLSCRILSADLAIFISAAPIETGIAMATVTQGSTIVTHD
jgi:hypothetical protein